MKRTVRLRATFGAVSHRLLADNKEPTNFRSLGSAHLLEGSTKQSKNRSIFFQVPYLGLPLEALSDLNVD